MKKYRFLLFPAAAAVLITGTVSAASGTAAYARPGGPPAPPAAGHLSKPARSSPATRTKLGRFHHPKPRPFEHDQFGRPKLRVGKFRSLRRDDSTQVRFVKGNARPQVAGVAPIINRLTSHVAPYNGWVPEEPTTAAVGNTVVYTSNDLISFSVNGGASFVSFDPRTMYRDNPAGGPDGDQDVVYVPQINEFVWLIQYFGGSNGVNLDRLAVFPPSAVTAGGLTSWTYWNITAAELPGTDGFIDFPDLAFGDRYLYLTQDAGPPNTGSVNQTFIARIGLTNLANGLNLAAGPEAWRYILGGLFFGKVVQNTGSVAFWASNSSTSTMAASDWPESSVFWFGTFNVNVDSWPDTGASFASTFPDGHSWLNLYKGVVEGSVRIGDDLFFAWTAGRGSGQESWLSQPNVQLVEMTTSFHFVSQRAIWNPDYVFAWPNLNTATSLKGVPELGISLVWGGDKNYANAAVGDLTTSPFLLDGTVSSNADCNCGRWGDYLAVRPYYPLPGGERTAQFVGTGFGFNNPGGFDDIYVAFTG